MPAAPGLTLNVVGAVPRGRVLVAGELDVLTAPALDRLLTELLQAGYRQLSIDSSGVQFLGAAGVNVICRATVRYREAGGRLQVIALPAHIRHILARTGLDSGLDLDGPSSPRAATSSVTRVNGARVARGQATPTGTFRPRLTADHSSPASELGISPSPRSTH